MANFGGVLSTWIFNDPPRRRKATNGVQRRGVCVLATINRVWSVAQNREEGGGTGRQATPGE